MPRYVALRCNQVCRRRRAAPFHATLQEVRDFIRQGRIPYDGVWWVEGTTSIYGAYSTTFVVDLEDGRGL